MVFAKQYNDCHGSHEHGKECCVNIDRKPSDEPMPIPLSMEKAKEWVKKMKHKDGTTGEFFTAEASKEWLTKKGYIHLPIIEFYAVINMMKSDYCTVGKMFNLNIEDFYGELAKAFLEDPDAKNKKTSLYYQYIAE